MKKTDLAAKAMAVLIGALIALACSELFLRGVALYAEHRQAARNLRRHKPAAPTKYCASANPPP